MSLAQLVLLLMTAFMPPCQLGQDRFRTKFFQLIGTFGKQEKVSLEGIGEAGSFEALQDQIIEDQLKKRYIKDLLGLLQTLGVRPCGRKDEGSSRPAYRARTPAEHSCSHNRGVVDERYLEADPQSNLPKYNLYNLNQAT